MLMIGKNRCFTLLPLKINFRLAVLIQAFNYQLLTFFPDIFQMIVTNLLHFFSFQKFHFLISWNF